jgi:hypothetical protein
MDLEQALWDRLSSDSLLAGLLATYDSGPAMFFDSIIPADADMPYLWSPPNVGDVDRGSKTGNAREISRLLNAYCTTAQPDLVLVTILLRVRDLLNRLPLTDGIVSEVSGPVQLPPRTVGEGVKGMGLIWRHWHED